MPCAHWQRNARALRIDLIADVSRLWPVPELKLLYYLQVLFAFTAYGATTIVALYTMELVAAQPGVGSVTVESWLAATAVGFTLAGIVVLPLWGRLLDRMCPARVLGILLAPYLGLRGFFWMCSAMLISGWVLWRKRDRAGR